MGCGVSKSFNKGGWVWNLSCYNLFLQFLHYRRRNKRFREIVLSMLSCDALKRSRIDCGTLCLQESESDLRYTGKKILQKGWGNGKKYPWTENGICVYVCERKKIISFKIRLIILMYVRNVNIPFKKDFKFTKIPRHPFPLDITLKIAKETKKTSRAYVRKVTKHASQKVANSWS